MQRQHPRRQGPEASALHHRVDITVKDHVDYRASANTQEKTSEDHQVAP